MKKQQPNDKVNRLFIKPAKLFILTTGLFMVSTLLFQTLKLLGIITLNISFMIPAIILGTMIFIVALDFLLVIFQQKPPHIERTLPGQLSINQWSVVELLLTNSTNKVLTIQVYDYPPDQISFTQLPQTIQLGKDPYLLKYPIKPLSRGHFAWHTCEVSIRSTLGFWQKLYYIPLKTETKIYPDFTKLFGSHLKTLEQWIHYLGIKPQQRRGLGLEFHQLREFREGDTLRQIDWNATAKHGYPITKEYQDEKDQHILFLLDCGQRMRTQENNLSHFDHALNASLLLTYVALRQGDAVGLTTFATDRECYLAPKKGVSQLTTLLNMVYDLETSMKPADYSQAVQMLLAKVKRRSLIIIITNMRTEQDPATIKAFKLLSKHHQVLIANMREEVLDELCMKPIDSIETALTYCGNIRHLINRGKLNESLMAQNLPILDIRPSLFGPALINHYLSLKRSGVL